jgi:hypothetical protein
VPAGSSLHKVSAVSGNAWAIGERLRDIDTGEMVPLIMRFDGTRWTEAPMPPLAPAEPELSIESARTPD